MMTLLELCRDKDLILPLSTGPEKDYLLVELVKAFAGSGSEGNVVFLAQNYQSHSLFVNLIKLHTKLIPNLVHSPSQLNDLQNVVCILPDSKHVLAIAAKLKSSVKLLILTDLHKIYDNPNCDAIRLLNIFRESSPNSRFIGFCIPLQNSKFTIDYEHSRLIATTMATNFGVPVKISGETKLKEEYVELSTLKISQFQEFSSRYEELKSRTKYDIKWDRFVHSTNTILEMQKDLIEEFSNGDWKNLNLIRTPRGVPFLEPFQFFEVYGSVLQIYNDFGEICTLKAINLYETELLSYIEIFEGLPKYQNYKRLIFKNLFSLRTLRNCILLYLPKNLAKRLVQNQELKLADYLSLSSSCLNVFIEEYFQELLDSKNNCLKVIVHTETAIKAKVLSSWITDLSEIIANELPKNPLSSLNAFDYLSVKDEKIVHSKFIQNLFFYRKRKEMLKNFCEKNDKLSNILFINNYTELRGKIPKCDFFVLLDSYKNILDFIRSKPFLKEDSSSLLWILGEKSAYSTTAFWENIIEQEAFYFDKKSSTKVVHHPSVKRLAKFQKVQTKFELPQSIEASPNKNESLDPPSLFGIFKKTFPRFEGSFVKSREPFKCQYLYELILQNVDENESSMVVNKQNLCLIVPDELPNVHDFDIIHQYDQYRVMFRRIHLKIDLTVEQVQTLLKFNAYVYRNILEIDCQHDINGQSSAKLLVAPIDLGKKCLKFDVMKNCMENQYKIFHHDEPFSDEIYEDSIVCSDVTTSSFFHVLQVDHSKSPTTELPAKCFPTYSHFYKKVYDCSVSDAKQPLLEVLRLSTGLNLSMKKPKKPKWIIPEFYRLWTLPYSLWMKITILPVALTNLFAQVNVSMFNRNITKSITTNLHTDPEDEDNYNGLPFGFQPGSDESQFEELKNFFENWGVTTLFDEVIDYVDYIDYGYGRVPSRKEQKVKSMQSLDLEQENQTLYEDFNAQEDAHEDLTSFVEGNELYEEALLDKTARGYKEIAAVFDLLQLELLYPQKNFEETIFSSYEFKMYASIAQNNLINSYREVLQKISLDEYADLLDISKNIDRSHPEYFGSDEANIQLSDFCDYNLEALQIQRDSENICQIFKDSLKYYYDIQDQEKADEIDSYHGSSAREFYNKFKVQLSKNEPPVEYENFNRNFLQTSLSKEPKLLDLVYISSLAYLSKFEYLKTFATIGKSFIRYVLTNAVLSSSTSSNYETTCERLNNLKDEYHFEQLCAQTAIHDELSGLIGLQFNIDHWCPPLFTRNSQITQDGKSFNPTLEHLVSSDTLAKTVQAFVGLYYKEAGPKVAMEVMIALGFERHYKIDIKKFKQYQWKISTFSCNIFKFNNPKLLTQIENDFKIDELQSILQYRFKNRNLLLSSMVDPSLVPSKMKFLSTLGKNILDYIIIHSAFRIDPSLVLSNDYYLTSSNAYSLYALEIGLDKFVAFKSTEIFKRINYFLREYHQSEDAMATKHYFTEEEINDKDLIEIPSLLLDCFQALFGSIYIDSEFSLQAVYKVFSPFLARKIDSLRNNELINPVQELEEIYGNVTSIAEPVILKDGNIVVQHDVYRGGRIEGKARSEQRARELGAKQINRYMLHNGDVNANIQDQGYQYQGN